MKKIKFTVIDPHNDNYPCGEIEAYQHSKYLAVHRCPSTGNWKVSHLKTTACMRKGIRTRKGAVEVCESILACGVDLHFSYSEFWAMDKQSKRTLYDAAWMR